MPQTFDIDIGTSEDSLSLADGLPLFPKIGTSRAGIQTTARSSPLLDGSATVLFLRWKVATYYSIFMGVLGPAVSFKFPNCKVELLDTPMGGQVNCDLGSGQQMVAGMAIGFVVGAGLQITQEIAIPKKWYAPWDLRWHTVFDLTLEVEIDFIKLLLELIKFLLGESGKNGYLTRDTSDKLTRFLGYGENTRLAESFKFYGYSEGQLGPEPTVTANPNHAIPFDLMNSIPSARAFMRALAGIVGDVKLGPTLAIQMPVTFGITGFTVTGSEGHQQYSLTGYEGSTAVATGGGRFTSSATRFSTNVQYQTGFEIGVAFFFEFSLLKVFSIGVTTPSLNLIGLLGLQVPETVIPGQVSTEVQTGCILIPKMSLAFIRNTNLLPNNNVISGIPFQTRIFLDLPWEGGPAQVKLSVTPPLAGFPESLPIVNGQSEVSFNYTVPNQCVLIGDFNDPTASVPASATSTDRTFLVTASLPPNGQQPCTDWEVTVPLKVYNRCLSLKLVDGTPGLSPVWNSNGGAQLNADPAYPPAGVSNSLQGQYAFNSVPGDTDTEAEITISLYNDERQLHAGSNVTITFAAGQSARLSPSARLTLPIRAQGQSVNFTLEWLSTGPQVNYSTLFYLVMDGGCAYGQGEFWLTVWNWT